MKMFIQVVILFVTIDALMHLEATAASISQRGNSISFKEIVVDRTPSAIKEAIPYRLCPPAGDNSLGVAALADVVIAEETPQETPPMNQTLKHTNQYIINDLNTPTTTAPQKFLRSLCQNPRGVYSHPLDCRKFVDCWDGRVREKYCPDNQVFSDLPGGFCDYLEYVDCGDRPLLPISESTTTMTTTSSINNNTRQSIVHLSNITSPLFAKWFLVRQMR